jgi:hypothetical protein
MSSISGLSCAAAVAAAIAANSKIAILEVSQRTFTINFTIRTPR